MRFYQVYSKESPRIFENNQISEAANSNSEKKKYTKITKNAKNKTYLKKWNHEKSKTQAKPTKSKTMANKI